MELADLAAVGPDHADAAVMLYVHAGIAAADVICCARLGKHAQGEAHAEAVELLRQAMASEAPALRVLLGLKTRASYGYHPVGQKDLARARRAAERLVAAAR